MIIISVYDPFKTVKARAKTNKTKKVNTIPIKKNCQIKKWIIADNVCTSGVRVYIMCVCVCVCVCVCACVFESKFEWVSECVCV